MNQSFFRQLMLYRYRYVLSYILFLALLGSLLFLKINSIPDGISTNETASIVQSASMPLGPNISPVDLPYHLLQKASLHFIGLDVYGIKLPSLIIGMATGLGILFLFQRLFKKSVAIVAAIMAVTASGFLIAGRTGDPSIMLIFWPLAILLQAALISQQHRFTHVLKLSLGFTIVLSLYTPFMAYLLISALIAALIHPHLRYIIRGLNPAEIIVIPILSLIFAIPLLWGIYNNPGAAIELAGFPKELPSLSQYGANLLALLRDIFGFDQREVREYILPAYGIGTGILMLFGLFRALRDFHSARSHMILVWLALLLPALVSSPPNLYVLFAPLILLLAIGIEALIREWYKLFPHNPYARVTALLPLGILLVVVVSFNYSRYFNGYAYAPSPNKVFSNDLLLLSHNLPQAIDNRASVLVVDQSEVKLYDLLRRQNPKLSVVSPPGLTQDKTLGASLIISTEAKLEAAQIRDFGVPSKVLVNDRAQHALRFRVFN